MKWTKEEIEILKENYGKMTSKELTILIPRFKPSSIRQEAVFLNLVSRHVNKWTKRENQILKEYYGKLSIQKLSKKLSNRTVNQIYDKACREGLHRNYNKWTNEEIELLKQNHGIISNQDICLLLNKSLSQIGNKIYHLSLSKRNGWKKEEIEVLKKHYYTNTSEQLMFLLPNRTACAIRTQAERLNLKSNRYTYSLNHFFFSKPNILNCYWAGYLAADGNLKKDKKQIRVSSKDDELIFGLKKDLQYDGPIYRRRSNNHGQLEFTSHQIYNDLSFWNIVPNKSLILKPPILSDKLALSFICGLIDGDGWITTTSTGRLIIGICGTIDMVNWCNNYFSKILDRKSNKVSCEKNKNHGRVVYSCTPGEKIYRVLSRIPVKKLTRKWKYK